MIRRENHPRRRGQVIAQQASETTILLSLENGQYYTLNEVGGRVWALCDGSRRVADMVAIIQQDYEAPAEIIEADILELLEELIRAQLVVDGSHETTGGTEAPA